MPASARRCRIVSAPAQSLKIAKRILFILPFQPFKRMMSSPHAKRFARGFKGDYEDLACCKSRMLVRFHHGRSGLGPSRESIGHHLSVNSGPLACLAIWFQWMADSRRECSNIIHQQPNLMPGEPITKRGHRYLAFADFPAERSISLLPHVRIGEIGRADLKNPGDATVSFALGAVANEAFLLVERFSLRNGVFVGREWVYPAGNAIGSCPGWRL